MIKRPAIYELRPGTKVLDALELAGGLSSNAFKGRVRLDRVESHKRKVVLDIQMEKVGGSANPQVMDGDILFVDQVLDKEFEVVYLKGNVTRPGRFEYKKGMNVRDLIPTVKDLKSETFFTFGHIKRATDDDQGSLLLPFSLKEVFDNNANVPLMPRDTVIIYSRYDLMDQPEVRVTGVVRRPGTYPFVDKMRVSDLVIAGGGLTAEAYLPQAHIIRQLKVKESDSLFSTLLKVNLSNLIDNPGDENNVELQPSDSMIIFPRGNFILPKSVSIHGSVKKEGDYQLTQNMGIPELISQSEGFKRSTYKVQIEVIRQKIENDSVVKREIHRINLKDVMEGKAAFELQDGDAVYIRDVVNYNANLSMTLQGEFNFPGKYQVAKGEKLSSVIRRAGGFTGSSYIRSSVFIRKNVKQRQLSAIDDISRRLEDQMRNLLAQTTNEKDRATVESAIQNRRSLLEEARHAPYLGRVVVNLDRDFKFANGEDDLAIEDGDSLFIPSKVSTISILGEVFSPTNVVVGTKTRSVGACLSVAGGVNEYGDETNIYYLRPDGTVITPKNTSFFKWKTVEPGGTIIVPPKGPKKDYLDAMAKITQIIYQIAISVGVAKTVF
jgi:polysaccharide biosynthesis/export protein